MSNPTRITGAGGLGVGAQASNAETLFNTLLPAARSDPAARAQLVSILPSLLNLKREQLGSTTDFFAFTNFLQTTLAGLVDESATVATLDDIGQSRAHLPPDTAFVSIEGGNHAQFGWYGDQRGDHPATIPRPEQQRAIVDATSAVLLDLVAVGG